MEGAAADHLWRTVVLTGWGRTSTAPMPVLRPESTSRVTATRPQGWAGVARGLGRSYGDASLGRDYAVDMTRLDAMLAFRDGLLSVEAGVTIGDIVRTWLPRGWLPAVTPGTQWVTVGGAIAADVHGKNQHTDGTFGCHVADFDLLTAAGEVLHCSPTSNERLFRASIGGMGLTGIILRATLRLQPVGSGYFHVRYRRTAGWQDTLDWFSQHGSEDSYNVAWIDGLAQGRASGRAVVMAGRPLGRKEIGQSGPAYPVPPRARRLPCNMPAGLLNRADGSLFNLLYYARHPRDHARRETWWKFFYPLDLLDNWNLLYGRRGFCQYQAVFPAESAAPAIRSVFATIHEAGQMALLGVLKGMTGATAGLLSFPRPGLTLAVDVPFRGEPTIRLFQRLYDLTADHGGRAYLAKDALLTPRLFRRMYPEWEDFARAKAEIDPDQAWRSRLSDRVGLTGELA